MAEKTGAGGKPQEYNSDNGQYGGSGGEIKKAVDNYKPTDIKLEVDKFKGLERKYNYDLPIEQAKAVIDTNNLLSKQEYAIWSKKLADELHGDYIKNLPSGEKVIITKNKVVFSKGTFESPKILKVIKFNNALELELFMELL